MANKYSGTKTEENLRTAFSGESQARNKYTYFASKAKKDGFEQIADLFLKTADNEKEHAKMWFKELNGIGTTAENLVSAAKSHGAHIALYGHTHVPVTSYDGGLYLVNPGSVREGSFAVIDITDSGIMPIIMKIK